MRTLLRTFGAMVLALLLIGCGEDDRQSGEAGAGAGAGAAASGASGDSAACPAGSERCACHPDGTCDDGLGCASDLCVVLPGGGGTSGDAAAGQGGESGAGGEAGSSGNGGSGGTPGTGGAAGTSGSGGDSGSAAASGAEAGTSGSGGTGGNAGGTGDCTAERPGWTLVWSDEFDYDGLPDPARWGYEIGGHGWGNGEAQFYTDARLENSSVDRESGRLTITARRESWEGNEYTSAKLNSSLGSGNPGSWIGALIEIRARLPAGRGTWPAFWMMPDDCAEGWPNCGEIDIMEHVGYDEGKIHGTIHTDTFNHMEGTQIAENVVIPDATSAYHVYSLQWSADRLQWSVDGAPYHTLDREPAWGFAEWPFNDKPFHIKINIAVGGSWGGVEGIDESVFPVTLEIDYVCVYQPAG